MPRRPKYIKLLSMPSIFLLMTSVAYGEPCLDYMPMVSTLRGTVHFDIGYGPPNFGEDPKHDSQGVFAYIRLDKPVCVNEASEEKGQPLGFNTFEDNVKEIQLVPEGKRRTPRHLRRKHVEVTGQLFHRVSGGHRDVLIFWDSIKETPP